MDSQRKQKSLMIPLLLAGGVLAFYFINKSKARGSATSVIDDGAGGGVVLVDDGTGTGTTVVQPPPIIVAQSTSYPLVSAAAISDKAALQRYSNDPVFLVALDKMNDAEVISVYNYVMGYIVQGLKLYQYPNASGIFADGGWNTLLYNQIAAIRIKYNILK